MTLYKFNILEWNERKEALNQYGTFLDNHMAQIEKRKCYAIDKCFAEGIYDAEYKINIW